MKYILYGVLFLFQVLSVSCGCTRKEQEEGYRSVFVIVSEEEADSIRNLISEGIDVKRNEKSILDFYAKSGRYDSIIRMALPIFGNGEDVPSSVFAASYLALSYVKLNVKDSARYYLDYCNKHIDSTFSRYAAYHNTEAEYALKFDMDYVTSIRHFKEALSQSEREGNVRNQVALLGNIANIYSYRNDTSGLYYARAACDKVTDLDDPYLYAFSFLTLAGCEMNAGNYKASIKASEASLDMAVSYPSLNYMLPMIYRFIAESNMELGEYDRAGEFFRKAFSTLKYASDENVHLQLYLTYATYCLRIGDYYESRRYYDKAEEISRKTGNRDNDYRIYLGLFNVNRLLGNIEKALDYHILYVAELQRNFGIEKENEFNEILMEYERIKYENDLSRKELEISKLKRTSLFFGFVIIVIAVVLVSIYIVYKKRDNMYMKLVSQHQQLLKNREAEKARSELKDDDISSRSEIELFNRLENLMKVDKVYRDKDISLAKIAEMLDTNRTYVSAVINKYANKTFYNYIHYYRINEAISVISDPGKDVVLKALMDEIGYKSVSCFYRAFQNETGCTPVIYREKVLKLKGGNDGSVPSCEVGLD